MKTLTYCLLVDDDLDDQEMFLAATREVYPGLICEVENDRQRALLLLRLDNQIPDIIFLNINMPKINGFEFLAHLKEDVRLKDRLSKVAPMAEKLALQFFTPDRSWRN